jgi:hypothetical protein
MSKMENNSLSPAIPVTLKLWYIRNGDFLPG